MAKVTFSSLKIKNEENIKKFTFNDKEIEVLYLLSSFFKIIFVSSLSTHRR